MATRLTLTMTTSNTDGSSRHSECQQIASMLHAVG